MKENMKTVDIMNRTFDEIVEYLADNDFYLSPEEEKEFERSLECFRQIVPMIRNYKKIKLLKRLIEIEARG